MSYTQDQFEFRKYKGRRKAILALRLIIEKTMEKRQNSIIYIGFVGLEHSTMLTGIKNDQNTRKKVEIKYRERARKPTLEKRYDKNAHC